MKDSAGVAFGALAPRAATSAGEQGALLPKMQSELPRLYGRSHHFPFSGAPFFGMKMVPGGVILLTAEKLRSFSASPILPRESTYSKGSPTATSINVFI